MKTTLGLRHPHPEALRNAELTVIAFRHDPEAEWELYVATAQRRVAEVAYRNLIASDLKVEALLMQPRSEDMSPAKDWHQPLEDRTRPA